MKIQDIDGDSIEIIPPAADSPTITPTYLIKIEEGCTLHAAVFLTKDQLHALSKEIQRLLAS